MGEHPSPCHALLQYFCWGSEALAKADEKLGVGGAEIFIDKKLDLCEKNS